MKGRLLVEMLLGVSVAAAVLVFVATASAGQVTKIMYAQENSVVYSYLNATTTGTLSVSIGWTDMASGVATTFPVGQVDGDIFSGNSGGMSPDPYADLSWMSTVATLFEGTNPEVGSYVLPAGQTAYIAVLPFVGDNNYTIDLKFNGTEVTGFPKTAPAYAASGEVYVPSDGDWISSAQYWPGTESLFYANWYDQVYERVAPAGLHDTLSEQRSPSYWAPQNTQRTNVGGSGFPQSSKWYTVAPQIWPGAAIENGQNVRDPGNVKPGTVSATTAPLWYTYSYPDDSVTGDPVAYFWGVYGNTGASRHSFSAECARAASFSARFSGNSVTWVYLKGPGYGIANVSIDGVSKGTVSQFNAGGFVFKASTTFSGLSAGNHSITITNAGKDPLGSTNTTISNDALLATGINESGDPTPVTDLENDTDGETTYHWGTYNVSGPSGGSFSADTARAAALAFEFSGTSITWMYLMGPGYGRAHVYIDGVDEGLVSQFNPSSVSNPSGFLYQQTTTFTDLADTQHIILILNAGKDPRGSTNTTISNDAFIVGETTYQN